MKDRFGRTLDCLRVSVTHRCNLRCRYCMPADYTSPLSDDKLLSLRRLRRS